MQHFLGLRAIRGLIPALGSLLAGAALAAPDAAMQERLAPCIACHGAGTSETEGIPSLGGQMPDYVVTQLFQFREKQREAPPMNDVAAGFSDDDLRAYADAVGTLPPPAQTGDPVDPALMGRAQALVAKHQCTSCHGADLAGRDAIPRIRDQREGVSPEGARRLQIERAAGLRPRHERGRAGAERIRHQGSGGLRVASLSATSKLPVRPSTSSRGAASAGLEGGLQKSPRSLEGFFEASAAAPALQDEAVGLENRLSDPGLRLAGPAEIPRVSVGSRRASPSQSLTAAPRRPTSRPPGA